MLTTPLGSRQKIARDEWGRGSRLCPLLCSGSVAGNSLADPGTGRRFGGIIVERNLGVG